MSSTGGLRILNAIETFSNQDSDKDNNGIRQWHQLQNTINARADEQNCKELNCILKNYNVKSQDFTLCRGR